jgi:hypothetical protein
VGLLYPTRGPVAQNERDKERGSWPRLCGHSRRTLNYTSYTPFTFLVSLFVSLVLCDAAAGGPGGVEAAISWRDCTKSHRWVLCSASSYLKRNSRQTWRGPGRHIHSPSSE